ncbi:D-alanyl-D-alanine carboxypeptidase [Acetobacteraceae bacterium]|nr:D-alanyl-D-alanine carboxypeptidase [Acetobacteraceae bacterium]
MINACFVRSASAQYVGQMSTFVANVKTGKVIRASNPDLPRYPASLTKLMTLYLAFDALKAGRLQLNQRIPVSQNAAHQEPSRLGLYPGSYLTVQQAIYGITVKSANDAAAALGEYLGGGSEKQFAKMMTAQAHQLGMWSTYFKNASGLPDPDQITTARDMARLGQCLLSQFPEYYRYLSAPAFTFHRHIIQNHNPILSLYAGADGGKTGYTVDAGHNLVTTANRQGVRVVGVVMGAATNGIRTQEMISLLNAAYESAGQEALPLVVRTAPARPARKYTPARRVRHRQPHLILASYHKKGAGKKIVHAAPKKSSGRLLSVKRALHLNQKPKAKK